MTKTHKNKVRLPLNVLPSHYKLEIKPDLEASVFSGSEIITIKILKPSRTITIHSKDIDIETAKITCGKNEEFVQKITYNTDKETATFYFKNEIKKGPAKLSLTFSGIIQDNLRGLYKSKYKVGNEEKYIATTQFEATDARRAFPCFDEPAMKATFEVSLIIPRHHTAVSNTLPIEIKEHEGGYKVVSFSPTPIMSTYLLAFIAGEFEYIEGFSKNKVSVKVYTTKEKIHQAKFALDVAIRSLDFYEEYFDIPYPLPTLDLVAIPDFESGAMENWGAITFRESSMLVDEEHSSLTNKQWVVTTISHELAHQWFGNLVTMHWWTDLWLNEGFASYMEKVCSNYLFPQWRIWDLYISSGRYKNAIDIDSLVNSHPIEVELNHPDEISESFDMVSYEKGTAIIRMMALYIGEDKFKEGIRYYLKKYSYSNTKTLDLWETFEKVSDKPIKKMMSSWTKQAGFPLITLSLHKSDLWLTQERFFSSRKTRQKNKEKYLWQIPVFYKDSNKENVFLFQNRKTKFKNDPIHKLNSNESCFMKVIYNKETLENLKIDIEKNHISKIDKLGIIRDLFSFAEGGYIKTSLVLDFTLSFINEKEFIIWYEISQEINRIYNLIQDKEIEDKYKKYVCHLFSRILEEVNKNESQDPTFLLLKNLIIYNSAFYGNKEAIKEIKNVFENRLVKRIDSDMRSIVYNNIIYYGKEKEWKIIKDMYLAETLEEERDRLARAMCKAKDKKIVEKTLEFISSKNVRGNMFPYLLATIWNNKDGRDQTWQFLKKNWETLINKYGGGGLLLSKIMFSLGNHNTAKDLKDAKKFFSKHKAPGAEKTVKQALEKIENNIAWWKDDKKDIKNWLNNNYK